MKANKILMISALTLMVAGCSGKGGEKAVENGADSLGVNKPVAEKKASLPSKGLMDSTSYYMGVNYGSMLKQYGLENLDYKLLVKGLKDFMAAKGTPQDADFGKQFKYNPDKLVETVNSCIAATREYNMEQNKVKEEKFLAENAKNKDVTETPTGLQYTILEPGNDNKPTEQDTVYVHYKGTLLDGTVFDEVPADQNSARLLLTRVISGWREGLQLIGEGGKMKLYIPSKLGYGEHGNSGIEPYSTLLFDVQIDSVHRYVEPAEASK